MTQQSDNQNRNDASDSLHGIFAGFNEAYVTSILTGDAARDALDGTNGIETDFEYTGASSWIPISRLGSRMA